MARRWSTIRLALHLRLELRLALDAAVLFFAKRLFGVENFARKRLPNENCS